MGDYMNAKGPSMTRTEVKIETQGTMEVWPGLMRWEIDELCAKLDPVEQAESAAWGYTANDALTHCMMAHLDCTGFTYSVRNKGLTRGAFGLDLSNDAIWALFADNLTISEQKTILRNTSRWVRMLASLTGTKRAHNAVSAGNLSAIKWLEASKCFQWEPYEFIRGGLLWRPFTTKPLSELPHSGDR